MSATISAQPRSRVISCRTFFLSERRRDVPRRLRERGHKAKKVSSSFLHPSGPSMMGKLAPPHRLTMRKVSNFLFETSFPCRLRRFEANENFLVTCLVACACAWLCGRLTFVRRLCENTTNRRRPPTKFHMMAQTLFRGSRNTRHREEVVRLAHVLDLARSVTNTHATV